MNKDKLSTDFIKSVKFFFIIYALCVVLSLINGIGDGDLFPILLVSFMPYFLGCYIPYIILKFIGFFFQALNGVTEVDFS